MHVAHFHPPRAIAVTLIAAVLAIAVTLAITGSVSDLSAGFTAPAGRSPVSRLVPSPPWGRHSTVTRFGSTPAWLMSPFSPLLGRPIPPVWNAARGS